MHVMACGIAIAVLPSNGGAQEADRLIVADHFRADSRSGRGGADVHRLISLDLLTVGRSTKIAERPQEHPFAEYGTMATHASHAHGERPSPMNVFEPPLPQ